MENGLYSTPLRTSKPIFYLTLFIKFAGAVLKLKVIVASNFLGNNILIKISEIVTFMTC